MTRILLWLALCLAGFVAPAAAQQTPLPAPRQVFLTRSVDAAGNDRLSFVNLVTGQQASATVRGQRYTVLPSGVIFFDPAQNKVKWVLPDGDVRDHPFIQPSATTRRIDWLLSADERKLVWTLTEGVPGALTTTTTLANVDGTNPHQVLIDGPREGIRALPVALSKDALTLYMDYQPDTIGDLTPFRQYAGLFQVDIAASEVTMLPGEPGCFCGGAIAGSAFLRLGLTDDLRGFNIHLYDLTAATATAATTIPALNLVGFTQAGDVLISPDGAHAIYALAQVRGFGTPQQTVRTVFVLVDLARHTQTSLTDPTDLFVRPVAWSDATSILFTSPLTNGTWKVLLGDGELNQVASATYLGLIP